MSLLSSIAHPGDLRNLPEHRLGEVATEIREAICEQVKKTGGHLAPNLGVIELTIALHYVFDFSHDRLLFDVGHQCYPHKLLTGRFERLHTLRQTGGISGFPDPDESPWDLFAVGHAGTSISTACGMARGDAIKGEGFHSSQNPKGRRTVALIGDASIVNGVAMEGLNHSGTLERQFLVVLNDNGMSISHPQGAVARYFDRFRVNPAYLRAKQAAREITSHLPGGSILEEMYHRLGEMAKDAVAEDSWFEKFGLLTLGPVDGHDLPRLIGMLQEVKDIDRPLLLHVHTVKGKGYDFSELDATAFHSPKPFNVKQCRVEMSSSGRSFTAAFSDALAGAMAHDEKIVACTAAMPDGTGLDRVLKEYPDRSWDTGICESHAMDMMAGLAHTGYKPFFAVYSTFLQRAFDQVFQEVALQGLPVRLCLDRAGLVGGDGAVHHGFCDISLLRVFPAACLLAAMDEPSLVAAIEFMRTRDDGLTALRYPRDAVSDRFTSNACPPFVLGKARLLIEAPAPAVAVLAYGITVIDAAGAIEDLGNAAAVNLYDARFARPVDIELVSDLLENGIRIITVEDHGLEGGFGSCVLDAAHAEGLDTRLITRLGIPCHWFPHGARADQLRDAGIDREGIARAIRIRLEEGPRPRHARHAAVH